MPWPDFTELTFGYAYLRELERRHASTGGFPLAPDFISQNEEAKKGYDVKVTLEGATPLFVQFKRSFVLTRKSAREVQDGTYPGPQIFRMHLHKRGAYRQHKALQRLEAAGHEVQYVTSQIYARGEFERAFTQQHIVSHAAAHFLPSEIVLPNETQDHHVSFRAEDAHGFVFSEEGRPFPRKILNFDLWASRVRERRRPFEDNLRSLTKAVQIMSEDTGRFRPISRLLADKPIEQQASILAYLTLDAQLTFVRDV